MNDENDKNDLVTVDDRGWTPADVKFLEIKNLIVSPAPIRRINLGSVDSLVLAVDKLSNNVEGVIWNEYEIALITKDGMDLRFKPIFDKSTTIFFEDDDKTHRGSWGDPDAGKRIWEGEFKPVLFTKTSLLKYLKEYSGCFDDKIQKSVRELKIKASSSSKELMLDDDGGSQKNVEEIYQSTNIPKTFTASLPLFDGIVGKINFEAGVKKKDGKTFIELRCTNAKEVLRSTIEQVLKRLPVSIPTYYGSMRVESGNEKNKY